MSLIIYDRDGNIDLVLGAPPAPLPALETVPCPTCQGDGYLIAADPMLSTRCVGCFGSGQQERCSVCKTVPWVAFGAEACLCTFPGAFTSDPQLDPEVKWALESGMVTREQVGL